MTHACMSQDQGAHDRDWRDEVASDHHVNNHPNHRADPDRDDEEE